MWEQREQYLIQQRQAKLSLNSQISSVTLNNESTRLRSITQRSPFFSDKVSIGSRFEGEGSEKWKKLKDFVES